MMAPVTYGNGVSATPTGIATFNLRCQNFRTTITCPVLELANELDVVLGDNWLYAHQAVISYQDEQVTFVYKDRPRILQFDDSRAQSRVSSSSLCSIRQAARFVHRQQRAFLVMVRRVAELPAGDATHSNRTLEDESPQTVDPPVLQTLLEEFKDLFPESLPGLPPDRGVQVSIPLIEGAEAVRRPMF